MERMNCEEAKKIDLVDYLSFLGHMPQQIKNTDYWYLSPLRSENTPSFKVNRKLNVWYDHGIGKGGDLLNFGTQYFKCSVSDLLQKLSLSAPVSFSFHPQISGTSYTLPGEKENSDSKIIILDERPLIERSLLDYLQERCISVDVASCFCKEVDFTLYGKKHTVIGFSNDIGGYELRSGNFKGSSAPKGITMIGVDEKELTVFEGFFNFLSLETVHQKEGKLTDRQGSKLILNSLSFFEKSRSIMDKYAIVNLYLDRDTSGMKFSSQALQWDEHRYKDRSLLYQQHKDLNDWLKEQQQTEKHNQRVRRSFRL